MLIQSILFYLVLVPENKISHQIKTNFHKQAQDTIEIVDWAYMEIIRFWIINWGYLLIAYVYTQNFLLLPYLLLLLESFSFALCNQINCIFVYFSFDGFLGTWRHIDWLRRTWFCFVWLIFKKKHFLSLKIKGITNQNNRRWVFYMWKCAEMFYGLNPWVLYMHRIYLSNDFFRKRMSFSATSCDLQKNDDIFFTHEKILLMKDLKHPHIPIYMQNCNLWWIVWFIQWSIYIFKYSLSRRYGVQTTRTTTL